MIEAVIVDAVRTPIGRALRDRCEQCAADELAATPLRALIERNPGVDFAETADVMMGAASGTGEQGYNVGRNALLLAGIDERVPAAPSTVSARPRCRRCGWRFTRSPPGRGSSTSPPGVESVSRAGLGGGAAPASLNPRLDGSIGSLCDVVHPDGGDGRERCQSATTSPARTRTAGP